MRRTLAAGSLLGALALGSPPARAGDPKPGAFPAVVLPDPVACTLKTNDWVEMPALELEPGVPYAAVPRPDSVEVLLPVAAAPAALGVKLVNDGVALQGTVPADQVHFHPSRAFVVGDLFVPLPYSYLGWKAAAPGEVEIDMELPEATMKVVTGIAAHATARRPCADLQLDPAADFEPLDGIGRPGRKREGRLQSPSPVPVSLKPGGPPAAQLIVTGPDYDPVTIIERRGRWSRISVELSAVALFGWVPARSVRPVRRRNLADTFGGLGLAPPPGPVRLTDPVACNHEVPLIAEARGKRRRVGTIAMGVPIHAVHGATDLAVVELQTVHPVAGARFLVARADIAGCPGPAPQVPPLH